MATVGTEISLSAGNLTRYQDAFVGLRLGEQGGESIIPTRRIDFVADDVAIAAPGAGNNQLLTVICALPRGFAYRPIDMAVMVDDQGNGGNNFDSSAMTWMRDTAPSSTARRIRYAQMRSPGGIKWTDNHIALTWVPGGQGPPWPAHPWRPYSASEQVYWLFSAYNNTPDDIAYSANVWVSFLEYTIAQSYDWQIHSPVPVAT